MSAATRPRLLHVMSGAREDAWLLLRCAALIGRWGTGAEHAVASTAAGDALSGKVGRRASVRRITLPHLDGRPGPLRLQALAEALRGYDLVLTYGEGAWNAVLAHSLFGPRMGLPPLVHHLGGLSGEEAGRGGLLRGLTRAVGLARTRAVIVPTDRAEQMAIGAWRLPPEKVHRVASAVDTAAYAAKPRKDALPRVVKRQGEQFIGAMVGSGGERVSELIRSLPHLPERWQLVLLGNSDATREALVAEAVDLEVGHRFHMPGAVPDLARVMPLFDVFVVPGGAPADPVAVLGAMAAGLPVIAPAGEWTAEFVGEANRDLLLSHGGECVQALARVARDEALIGTIGEENRSKARDCFDERNALARLETLYARATGRDRFP